jgi:hypothetical protein
MRFIELKKIISCEGDILTIGELVDNSGIERLALRGLALQGRCHITCLINIDQLQLYLTSRVSLVELFTLRSDEPYFLDFKNKHEKVFFDDVFKNRILQLECGDMHFHQLNHNMRMDNEMEFLRILRRDYIHAYGSVSILENQFSGSSFINKYPELFN